MTPSLEALLKTNPIEAAKLMQKELLWWSKNKIKTFYPETGPLRRENYPKHMEFFRASKTHNEVCFLGANRSGKTVAGCYAVAVHLTGEYPPWWEGKRFTNPTDIWVAGDTNETTRNILQVELMGQMMREPGDKPAQAIGLGTGMIPAASIKRWTPKSGTPNAVDQVWVKHKTGGTSILALKSYDQGREAFQGTSKHVILFDEEPSLSVYTEALMRTLTTKGLVLLTFTPLLGISDVVEQFCPGGVVPLQKEL